MDLTIVSLTILGLLILFLGSTIWVGISLMLVGVFSFSFFTDNQPLGVLSNIIWNETNDSIMLSLPLFIFMGEILFRSKVSDNLFKGLSPWMTLLPGGLIHTNILSSSLFAAVSGSSAATTATVGKITLPELKKRNYSRALSLGTLAGAGTLGFLIPPSMMLIVYGIAANVSIGQLFIAGIVPGAMIALGLVGYTMVVSVFNKDKIMPQDEYTWEDRINSLKLILPVIILILIVLGSIYLGLATPAESAAVGVVGSLLLAFRSLSLNKFWEAVLGAVKTNAMIMIVVIGASYLSVVIGYLGIPNQLTEFVASMGITGIQLIIILTIMYIFLGTLLDGFSMIVMSLPLALPLITAAGFDPLWFGIYLVIMIEIAQITPPIGFNLFVINGLVEEDVLKIAYYAIPSFLILLVIAGILTIFPEIVMWLPGIM